MEYELFCIAFCDKTASDIAILKMLSFVLKFKSFVEK